MNGIFEYIRLCCYILVGIISIFHFKDKKKHRCNQHKYHILSDFIIAFGLGASVLGFLFGSMDKDCSRNFILTPIAIVWTGIIYYKFMKK